MNIECCENTVAKLMQRAGIRARTARKFRAITTNSDHALPVAPNRLDQCFTSENVNRVWLTDFTYIPLKEGFTYLCTCKISVHVVSLAGQRVHQSMRSLAIDALQQAVALRRPDDGLIVHSDRGSQFASEAYRSYLSGIQALQSKSRKGNCYDNAPMESFFKSYKVEEVSRQRYESHEQATRGVIDYIERFYNPVRTHSSLGYLSPIEFENQRLLELETSV